MFFQISPVVGRKRKPVEQKKPEQEEIDTLSLAPFGENPKIVFDNVIVGTTIKRKLVIKNPTNQDITLFVRTSVPDELNFSLSWNKATIEKNNEHLLEMIWAPIKKEASRYSFILLDGKRISRNIGVTFKAICAKEKTGNGTKKPKTAVNLPLIRKPVSPVKKLRPLKNSPIRNPLKNRHSPSPHRKYSNNNGEVASHKKYSSHGSLKPALKENKENTSPVRQEMGNFLSPTNNPFFTDKFNANYERRDTYVVDKENIPKNATFQLAPSPLDTKESFYLHSEENSPYFRDSLDSPRMDVLRTRNVIEEKTPTLESLVRPRKRLGSTTNTFEDRLKVNKFTFSPGVAVTPQAEHTFTFAPEVYSTGTKPPSSNNSLENANTFTALDFSSNTNANGVSTKWDLRTSNKTFVNCNSSDCSLETYLRENISGDTFVKANVSGETFTKANVTGDTYVKDNSIGNIDQLDLSPVTTKTFLIPSPVRTLCGTSPMTERSTVLGKKLSMIAEETITMNETVQCNTFRVSTSSGGLHLTKYLNASVKGQLQPLFSISETTTKTVTVKNPLVYARMVDPFMTPGISSDDEWIEEQMHNFTKWLNALLTPPDELETNTEIDVAKVWRECSKKEVSEAPSKEALALKCHTNKKLDFVRRQARQLYRSAEVSAVLQKVDNVIETGRLSIREDKDPHLNLQLKSDVTRLILGYNPLWLRIGLETIYDEIVPMRSNSDTHTLATFILERLLKDPQLMRRYKNVYASKYSVELKKFILKKFLSLVYFLDRAKSEKLIQHDPCLFCKNALEKESKLVLTHFARETLSAVGDITKYLKCLGYVVTHVQQYIHEFDYAVKNLGGDLRDGVRLTRVMEIIQMRSDLTAKLRVPAISRLQKIHNLQVVFKSLQDCGYKIQHDIGPKDIVEGHKEKNLSFLWQIIYKFEAPLMVKSATTIQTWFRSLPVQIKRDQLRREREKRENAARKIQLWYRRQKLAEKYFALGEFIDSYIEQRRRHRAAVKIQSFFRMWVCQRQFEVQYRTVTMLQAYAKGWLVRNYHRQRIIACITIQKVFRGFLCRKRYLALHKSVVLVQQRFKANRLMTIEKQRFESLREHVVKVQRRFRATRQMKLDRERYLAMKFAAIKILSWYRMCVTKKRFMQLKESTILIQKTYRAQREMKLTRLRYLALKQAAIFIQRRFRANKEIKQEALLRQEAAALKIQSYFKMCRLRNDFLKLKSATVTVQVRFRALIAMKRDRAYYLALKEATIVIQRRFRANQMMTIEKQRYECLREHVVKVQKRFRATRQMKLDRERYIAIKSTAIKIQSWYRMCVTKKRFIQLKESAILIQKTYRAQREMKLTRLRYLALKQAAIFIQRRFRANKEIKQEALLRQEAAALKIQSYFKMCRLRNDFLKLKSATVTVQVRFRALIAMKRDRAYYLALKEATIVIQRRFRANQMMTIEKQRYECLREHVVKVQKRFRATRQMKLDRERYIAIKSTAIKIQSWYRMCVTKKRFIQLKESAILIQKTYRAQRETKLTRLRYLALKQAAIFIQRRFRANKEIKQEALLRQEAAALKIQSYFKMCRLRNDFLKLKSATVTVQVRFRALIAMKRDRAYYLALKGATRVIQRRFRANVAARTCREDFVALRSAAITIQRRFRINKLVATQMMEYCRLKWAAIVIQRRYRANKAMKEQMEKFKTLRSATFVMQRRWKATLLAREQRRSFLKFKESLIIIQRFYRDYVLTKRLRSRFLEVREAVLQIQRFSRGYLVRKKYAALLKPEAVESRRMLRVQSAAAVKIQALFRGYRIRKSNIPEVIALRKRRENRAIHHKPAGGTMTLAERCDVAMTCMIAENSSLLMVISALEDIDFISRHSQRLCLVLSQILPIQLYLIIKSAARSLPEMNALNTATAILINFCKYPKTREHSWSEEHIDDLVNVMLHWCDKEAPLFSTLCTLVWLFGHEDKWKKVLISLPNIQQRFSKIRSLVNRKQSMVMKSTRINHKSPFGPINGLKLPTRTANWGLDYDRPNTFTNAVFAVTNVMKILNFLDK
ncbi:abnormal spindle-like microcephaly-associated protein homolog isoform X2 [Anthonomus grandis grandis]|uniref:abnormal spindle-like microcephaly-associated protein homolog isoform X2 n=1 Tax=Anthonomus grandis grandis TaxID=2921223 RepID=UPI00216586D3|nr:abnormal spindle-like microcephaly-associated protein homolog isoform X2 [Anthonomus grandis grandis]